MLCWEPSRENYIIHTLGPLATLKCEKQIQVGRKGKFSMGGSLPVLEKLKLDDKECNEKCKSVEV